MNFPDKNWIYKNPEDVGLTDELLDDLDDFIGNRSKKLKSLIIIKDGSIVYEEYFNGGNPLELYRQMSITKSINCLALGIMIDKGIIDSENDKLIKYLPEYSDFGEIQKNIIIKDLLHMSSGMFCKSKTANIAKYITAKMELSSVPIVTPIYNSKNPLEQLLKLPVIEKDYGTYCYNTASSFLLVEIMKTILNESYTDFIHNNLFKPMGITQYMWDKEIKHDGYLISLRTLDLARFGLLMLNNGKWNGKQLVKSDWTKKSLTPGVTNFYGYQWWLVPGTNVFYGAGHGGQALICIPEENIILAGNCNTKDKGFNGITPFQVYFDFLEDRLKEN